MNQLNKTRKKPYHLLALVMTVVLASAAMIGCDATGKDPLKTAEAFWQALSQGEISKARALATPDSRDGITIRDARENEAHFSEVVTRGEIATIETLLTVKGREIQGKQAKHEMTLTTVLVNEQGRWYVDYNETRQSISASAALKGLIEEFGESASEEMKELIEKAQESLEEGVEALREGLSQPTEEQNRNRDHLEAL